MEWAWIFYDQKEYTILLKIPDSSHVLYIVKTIEKL